MGITDEGERDPLATQIRHRTPQKAAEVDEARQLDQSEAGSNEPRYECKEVGQYLDAERTQWKQGVEYFQDMPFRNVIWASTTEKVILKHDINIERNFNTCT